MKRNQVKEYRPNYPKKLLRGAILATAAAVTLTGTTACMEPLIQGNISVAPTPGDELVLDGEVAYDDTELLPEGEPDGSGEEEPALMGKIVVPEATPEP